jgi:hypothetical protein
MRCADSLTLMLVQAIIIAVTHFSVPWNLHSRILHPKADELGLSLGNGLSFICCSIPF